MLMGEIGEGLGRNGQFLGKFPRQIQQGLDGRWNRVSLPSWTLPVEELFNSSKMLAGLIMGNHLFCNFFFFTSTFIFWNSTSQRFMSYNYYNSDFKLSVSLVLFSLLISQAQTTLLGPAALVMREILAARKICSQLSVVNSVMQKPSSS